MYTLSNLNFMGKSPKIDPDAFVAPRVFLAGDVRISRYASLWPGVVARGDVNYISIGECSNVQDLVCLHVADDFPCIIGDYVTIGHCACVHACTIEDHVLIGMNATVLTGASRQRFNHRCRCPCPGKSGHSAKLPRCRRPRQSKIHCQCT